MSVFPSGHCDRPTVSADVYERATYLPTSDIGLVEESFNSLVEISKLAAYTGSTPPCRAYRIFHAGRVTKPMRSVGAGAGFRSDQRKYYVRVMALLIGYRMVGFRRDHGR